MRILASTDLERGHIFLPSVKEVCPDFGALPLRQFQQNARVARPIRRIRCVMETLTYERRVACRC